MTQTSSTPRARSDLDRNIATLQRRFPGQLAVAATNLTTGEQVLVDADQLFPTASVIKVSILAELFAQADEGRLRLDERLEMPMILPPVPELVDLEEARVLIADDVADTGRTLLLVKDFCAGKVGEVRCAVLYEKPHSEVNCEYVWRRTDRWIDFPWSARPHVRAASVRRPDAVLE